MSANGRYAYVTVRDADRVAVIDLATGAVVTTIAMPLEPHGLALSPNGGYLHVTSAVASGVTPGASLFVISTATNRVVNRVNVGGLSEDVAFSPDGRYAYVSTWDSVAIVDTARQQAVGVVTLPGNAMPGYIAVGPRGRTLYLDSGYGSGLNALLAINPATKQVEATIGHGGHASTGLAVAPSGSVVYQTFAGGASGTSDLAVRVVSTLTNKVKATVTIPDGAEGVVFAAGGKEAYVSNADGSGLSVINTVTSTVERVIHCGEGGARGSDQADGLFIPDLRAISPDGRRAYVDNIDFLDIGANSLAVVDLPGT
jgi:YVTN family beta-propeller protein